MILTGEQQLVGRGHDVKIAVDEAIIACGGDMREAIKVLPITNNYLEEELAMVSYGYARGRIGIQAAI